MLHNPDLNPPTSRNLNGECEGGGNLAQTVFFYPQAALPLYTQAFVVVSCSSVSGTLSPFFVPRAGVRSKQQGAALRYYNMCIVVFLSVWVGSTTLR